MPESSVLKVIADSFGSTDYIGVADQVRSGGADEQVGVFLDSWLRWADEWVAPQAPPHSIRPFTLAHWKGDPTSGLSDVWQTAGWRNPALRNQLVRHLLYCDAIAVPDPLFGLGSSNPLLKVWGPGVSVERDRISVAEVIARLAPFAELFDAGVLVVVPHTAEPNLPTEMMPALTRIADEFEDQFPSMPADWLEITYARRAAIDLMAQMAAGDGDFDVYLPTEAHVDLFLGIYQSMQFADAAGVTTEPESRMLWRLLTCGLPDPSDLPMKEIVAMRRGGEFNLWRNAITQALEAVELLAGDGKWPISADRTLTEIRKSVTEAARVASTSIHRTRDKRVGFGLGVVGLGAAVAGSILVPPVAPALVAPLLIGGGGGLPLIQQVVLAWRRRRPTSFTRHVAVFDKKLA